MLTATKPPASTTQPPLPVRQNESTPSLRPAVRRIDSLTSLRFMAAAMIVISHSAGLFYMDPRGTIGQLPLAQGVSFFFVLSGFILTLVYRDLCGFKASLHFLAARVARVWPVLMVTEIATYLIAPATMLATTTAAIATTALTHFFMVQAWYPQRVHYFALNAPSWSISTEFFFYLAFPLLIISLPRNWMPKFFLTLAFPLTALAISYGLSLPVNGSDTALSQHGLLYVSPLSRIFEFYLGMIACLLVSGLNTIRLNRIFVTSLEVCALLLVAVVIGKTEALITHSHLDPHGPMATYIRYAGNCFGYFFLISSVGLEQGLLARLLNLPALIFLGEISYSVYLCHFPLLHAYINNRLLFEHTPRIVRYGLFWAALLGVAALSFFLIEKPCRVHLRRVFDKQIDWLAERFARSG